MVKLLGQRFTSLPESNSIGAFFEAMYQTGLFWNFIGASQVFAGLLLLVPRLSHVGALLLLPVTTCIVVINVALNFGATTLVTILMLVAIIYLLLWDYDRFRGILTTRRLAAHWNVSVFRLDRWEVAGFVVLAVALLVFFGSTRDLVPDVVAVLSVPLGIVAGGLTLTRFVLISARRRPGRDTM